MQPGEWVSFDEAVVGVETDGSEIAMTVRWSGWVRAVDARGVWLDTDPDGSTTSLLIPWTGICSPS